jgi:hypothetical protein
VPDVRAIHYTRVTEAPSPLGATVDTVLDTSLIPGRLIEPIDLANALSASQNKGQRHHRFVSPLSPHVAIGDDSNYPMALPRPFRLARANLEQVDRKEMTRCLQQ